MKENNNITSYSDNIPIDALYKYADTARKLNEIAIPSMVKTINDAATVMQTCRIQHAEEMANILAMAARTMEITALQENLRNLEPALLAFAEYIKIITDQWNEMLLSNVTNDRFIQAQNIALIRMIPNYTDSDLPRGGKTVLKDLTRSAAQQLTQTDKILFDPVKRDFCHTDSPDNRITTNQITVISSSLELFATIDLMS